MLGLALGLSAASLALNAYTVARTMARNQGGCTYYDVHPPTYAPIEPAAPVAPGVPQAKVPLDLYA